MELRAKLHLNIAKICLDLGCPPSSAGGEEKCSKQGSKSRRRGSLRRAASSPSSSEGGSGGGGGGGGEGAGAAAADAEENLRKAAAHATEALRWLEALTAMQVQLTPEQCAMLVESAVDGGGSGLSEEFAAMHPLPGKMSTAALQNELCDERGRLRLEGASREDLLAQVTAARKGDGDTLRVKALLRRGRALAAQGSQEELRAAKRDLKLGLAIHPKDPDVKKALERVRKAIKERDNIFRAISGGSWF